MGSLDNIIEVNITRETQAVTRAGFGTPAIIAEFLTTKTTVIFDRYRYYTSLTEMADDGWTVGDEVYDAAAIIFSQDPKVSRVMVGRKDLGDASWSAALSAIQLAVQDWYAFLIIASHAATVVFDIDFVTGNLIDFTVNETAVTQVPWNTSQAQTMSDIKDQIEADITNSTVTISDTKTLVIEVFGQAGVESAATDVVVTGGATQPTAGITYVNEDDYKAAAAWTETQKKLFFYSSSNSEIKNPASTTDIAYFMKNAGYDRTISCYHPGSQGDAAPAWFESGFPGETLPYDPGSQTWAYKTINGVASYSLTSGERIAMIGTKENPTSGKNVNIYTTTAGIAITERGQVASGEYIDIIRGLDWLESRLQEEIFTNLVNSRKIPYTDSGITIIAGIVQGVLNEAARKGILVAESIVLTVPKAADIPQADRIARNLPDVNFTATLQGAIHAVTINGTVSV